MSQDRSGNATLHHVDEAMRHLEMADLRADWDSQSRAYKLAVLSLEGLYEEVADDE